MRSTDDVASNIVRFLPAVAVNLRLSALFDTGPAELTPTQMLTLFLVDVAEGGRLRAGQISEELAVTMPAATAMVNRLVSAGLLTRSRGDDRRVVWVSLAEHGQSLVDEMKRGLVERVGTVVEAMDRTTQVSLMDALERVANFAHQIGIPSTVDAAT